MKTRAFIGFSLGLALTLTVPVSASAATTLVDPAVLGSADAMLNYCSTVNPVGATGYAQLRIKMFGTISAATNTALKATTQYKQGFDVVHTWLVGPPKGWATQTCKKLL